MGFDRWFSISFWFCCALLAVPLWSVDYLPMVDLPQHAAQISIWTRWSDPTFGYPEIYTRNWFTPYLFAYLLTFALTPFMSVKAALTTVITAAVIGVPLATRALVRQVGGNQWWVFAVFPGLFGFAFDWGFFNFLAGIPIALLLMVASLRHAESPTSGRAILLTGALGVLFFVHVLLFGYVAAILGLTTLLGRRGWRQGALALGPVIALTPMVLWWLYVTRGAEAMTRRAMVWEFGEQAREGHRLLRFISEVAGEGLSPWTLALGLLAFALPILLGGRPSRDPVRWVPFVVTVLLYVLVPHEILGTGFLYSRYAIFAIPTWLYALDLDPAYRPNALRSLMVPALAVGCTVATTIQFWAYEPEIAGLSKVISRMPENARVLSIPSDKYSGYIRTPVFLHAPVWYQTEKGGVVDFSFAVNFPMLFRYRPEHEPNIPRSFVWDTRSFGWESFDAASYDYFIVRAFGEEPSPLLLDSKAPVSLVGRVGPWQLFQRD